MNAVSFVFRTTAATEASEKIKPCFGVPASRHPWKQSWKSSLGSLGWHRHKDFVRGGHSQNLQNSETHTVSLSPLLASAW
jgi:hypothetical protein